MKTATYLLIVLATLSNTAMAVKFNAWVELETYVFIYASQDPLLDFLRKDSFVQLSLKYYF